MVIRRRIARDECGFTVTDLVNGARLFGDVDEDGNVAIDVPERCQEFFNSRGEPINQVAAAAGDDADNG